MQSTYEGEYTISQLNKALERTKGIMITGGEPTFSFPENDNFLQTILILEKCEYEVANVETNGAKVVELLKILDEKKIQKNIKIMYSPKVFNQKGLEFELEKIAKIILHPNVYLKIVPEDNELSKSFCHAVKSFRKPSGKVYLMPLGTTRQEICTNWKLTIDLADECGFNLSSRLHILHDFT